MTARDTLDFALPPEREASEPPEARGLARDSVRLLVSRRADDRLVHARFSDIGAFLRPGDLVVINTSATLNAALEAQRVADGLPLELHLSTPAPDGSGGWVVEARRPEPRGTRPFFGLEPGDTLHLPGGGSARIVAPYAPPRRRLWVAALSLPMDVLYYLDRHGFPIRYRYVERAWPGAYYQTAFAAEPGSAEMPSAGRAFTPEGIVRLMAQGVGFAPLTLHTGVASLEEDEPPYAERFRVPVSTARAVNAARAAGSRVIGVGTTVVRALETVAEEDGTVRAGKGWTELIVAPGRGVRVVEGLLTGFHEPRASHLAMLEALAGRRHVEAAYAAALQGDYLWHEFGDLHLILP